MTPFCIFIKNLSLDSLVPIQIQKMDWEGTDWQVGR